MVAIEWFVQLTPLQNWSKYNKSSFKEDMVYISVGQVDRFVHVAPRSLCPGPNRPLDTKKVVENTRNHLRFKLKIWIFVDFQAKSRLYAIAQTLKLQLICHYNQTSIWLQLTQFTTTRTLYGFSNHFYSKNFEIQRNLC